MSLGIDLGMEGEPTQIIESVVQVHPEGHLNIRFDRDSCNEQTNSKVKRTHLAFALSMALKQSRKAPLSCAVMGNAASSMKD